MGPERPGSEATQDGMSGPETNAQPGIAGSGERRPSCTRRLTLLLLVAGVIVPGGSPARGAAAGRLAEPGLSVDNTGAGEVVLSWAGSCLASDTDFEVYAGALGRFDAYAPLACSTGGATTYPLPPDPGDRFFLVVPRNATHEGSYGTGIAGAERPALDGACLPQEISDCPSSVPLSDLDSGQPSPAGNYRWMDVADQVYSGAYRDTYNYTWADVELQYFPLGAEFGGFLVAAALKPNFAYQVKIIGIPDTPSNERIGLTGRWWQEEWNGSQWTNGQNLNDKGDGSSPNPNDALYFSRRDIPDPASPTGKRYRYTGYVVFDYLITDATGSQLLNFRQNSSHHVLWKTSQRARTAQDGPELNATFDVQLPDPVSAYDVDFPEATITIFGEWERLPTGGVRLPPGSYEADFVLTEESFHGGGLAGGWAAAMGARIEFEIAPSAAVAGTPTGGTLAVHGAFIPLSRHCSTRETGEKAVVHPEADAASAATVRILP